MKEINKQHPIEATMLGIMSWYYSFATWVADRRDVFTDTYPHNVVEGAD